MEWYPLTCSSYYTRSTLRDSSTLWWHGLCKTVTPVTVIHVFERFPVFHNTFVSLFLRRQCTYILFRFSIHAIFCWHVSKYLKILHENIAESPRSGVFCLCWIMSFVQYSCSSNFKTTIWTLPSTNVLKHKNPLLLLNQVGQSPFFIVSTMRIVGLIFLYSSLANNRHKL